MRLDPLRVPDHGSAVNPGATPPRKPFFRRCGLPWILGAVGLVLIYTLVGFFLVPRLIRSQLLQRLPTATHRQAEVGRVQVNPFQLTLTVSNLTLIEPDGTRFASVERVHADLMISSLWRRAWVLREVEIGQPFLHLRRHADGTLNVDNLRSSPTNTPSGLLPRMEIGSFRMGAGELALNDDAIPGGFAKRFSSVELQFTNLSTTPQARSPGYFIFVGDTEEVVSWEGDLSLDPPASQGTFQVEAFPIPRQGPYLQLATTANITQGLASLGITYSVLSGENLHASITNASLRLTNLSLLLPDTTEPTLTLNEFEIGEISASLADQEARVGSLMFRDGRFLAQRRSDGSVDVAQAIRPEFVERAVQALQKHFAGWHLDVPSILGERMVFNWGDSGLPTATEPVRLEVRIEHLRAEGLSNRSNQPVRLDVTSSWGTNGSLTLKAEGTLLPAVATAELDFSHLSLVHLQPYVGERVHLKVTQGEVDGHWRADYNRSAGGPLITAQGNLEVNQLLAVDTRGGPEFLKWNQLLLRNVKGAWEPATVHVEEIRLQEPATSFILMTNGQFNALSLVRSLDASGTTAEAESSPTPPVRVLVDRLTFTNASLYAADQTVPGQFSTTIERFSGMVTDVAWPDWRKSHVELAGFVGPRAPFRVEGWVLPDPQKLFLDMRVTTTDAEVIPFTPYTVKFAGYPLREGRISADVSYRVEGRQVAGQNHVTVDRLTLGPRAAGQPLLDLPIKLGVILLKDANGRITLDIPVQGSLDDPEFGVRQVVWQAVKGLFTKVATAPFKLLGSLFGGSEEDGEALQSVEFDPGSTDLTAGATRGLEQLVIALDKRPELYLVMRGGASPELDGPVLAQQRLDAALHGLATGPAPVLPTEPSAPPLTSAERKRLLPRLFAAEFPGEAAGPESPTVSAEAMQQRLLEKFQPGIEELAAIQAARVDQVKGWLTSSNRLDVERIVLSEATDTNAPPLQQPVVEFSLE